MDELSRLDLAFCVDLTGSMTPFIDAARAQMVGILGALRSAARADLAVAVVGYRDHGAAEALEIHPFRADDGSVDAALQGLRTGSGPDNSDAAEAVFAGLGACLGLRWREGAYKVVVLVGDGPPHACGADGQPFPDRFPDRDPTGWSLDDLANRLESDGVFVNALAMLPSSIPAHDHVLERAFQRLSVSTGGAYQTARDARAAMKVVEAIVARVGWQLDFDRKLFAALDALPAEAPVMRAGVAASAPAPAPAAALSKELGVSEDEVRSGLMRLRQRKLIKE